MKTYVLKFVLLAALFFGFPSCRDEISGCGDVDEFFDITGIEISNYQISEEDFENGRNWQEVENGATIPFAHYFIRVFLEVAYYPEPPVSFNFDFSSRAYALSCLEPGYKGSLETIDTLYIITNQDFNAQYAAGDTLNDIAEVNGFVTFYDDIQGFEPLESYFEANQAGIQDDFFSIRFNEEPKNPAQAHSFTLRYQLDNGEQYSAQTATVKFQ